MTVNSLKLNTSAFHSQIFDQIISQYLIIKNKTLLKLSMLQNIEKILNIKKNGIQTMNKKINEVVMGYTFLYFSQNEDFEKIQTISQNIKDSKMIVIDYNQNQAPNLDDLHFIIGFKNTILAIHSLSLKKVITYIFSQNMQIEISFLSSNAANIFNQNITISYKEFTYVDNTNTFEEEYTSFQSYFHLSRSDKNQQKRQIWEIVIPCISGYLFRQSYSKLNVNRLDNYNKNLIKIPNEKLFDEDNYIELRIIDNKGSVFQTKVMYDIENARILIFKTPYYESDEIKKLLDREEKNYNKILLPFIPEYYGKIDKMQYQAIEYINGNTLLDIQKYHFSDKIVIIFEILLVFSILHLDNFVYRDLKPDNVMIDQNNNIVLIDFDRMVNLSDYDISNHTASFRTVYIAPEVNNGEISNKNDIYSIGQFIYYMMKEKNPEPEMNIEEEFFEDQNLCSIYKQCINNDADQRPSIDQLLLMFFSKYCYLINDKFLYLMDKILYYKYNTSLVDICAKYISKDLKNYERLALNITKFREIIEIWVNFPERKNREELINKAINTIHLAANKNDTSAQYNLGVIYYENKYIKQDIDKSIHYFSLAANQNHPDAQFNLGIIYYENKYIKQNINKSIHYFSLAANQNHPDAQFYLSDIYAEGKFVQQDMDKSIHYLLLAADQNHPYAQFNLGTIYAKGKFVQRDMDKSIHYYSLAADQNDPDAQFKLGKFYYEGEFVERDIDKSIHYYSLAANQNNIQAQYNLGIIYYENRYIKNDINKSIYYFSLAANQNNLDAQLNLGTIYLEGKYIKKDINKSIYYYSLAANNHNNRDAQFYLGNIYYLNQDMDKSIYYLSLATRNNHPKAQFCLGIIYEEGRYIKQNMNKSIYYYTLAADQNDPYAQFKLGLFYYNGEFVKRDIDKSIHYYTLSSNQNHPISQYNLGIIYYENHFIKRDIMKSIRYLSLAAQQNLPQAQFKLGAIFYEGFYIKRDIEKSIFYFSRAANQNDRDSQFNLGIIYLEGKYIKQDIKTALHYFFLAAKQNHPMAQFNLGNYYYEGKYLERDINKSIHYLTLASNQNIPQAQYNLGLIYFLGKYIERDIKKAIHYVSLAADRNDPMAQCFLGKIYCEGKYIQKNIKLGMVLIKNSSVLGNYEAHFALGFFYHEGIYIGKDIKIAVHHYKEASLLYFQYAKNNLGVIYKNGYDNKIEKNLSLSIEYFQEAINQKNDMLSMFNLSRIYIYEEAFENDIDKSIDLLIKSGKEFLPSIILLCIVLIKKNGFNINIENIEKEMENRKEKFPKITKLIIQTIEEYNLNDMMVYTKYFNYFRGYDFIYDYIYREISLFSLQYKRENMKSSKRTYITNNFYEGFGITE